MKVFVSVIRRVKVETPTSDLPFKSEQSTSYYSPRVWLDKDHKHVKMLIDSHFKDSSSQVLFEAHEDKIQIIYATLPLAATWTVVPTIKKSDYTLLYKVSENDQVNSGDFAIEMSVLANE
jgi:hypothetical protein